jgi:osmotically-inducible protein OsmY
MRTLGFATAMVAAWVLLPGCVASLIGNSPDSGTGPDMRARSATGADAALADEVRSRFSGDPALHGEAIEVSALGGTVTLRGRVASSAVRSSAERLVRTVAGVMAVNNLLKVN